MTTFPLGAQDIAFLTSLRRQIHAHPEVSGEEKETAARIVSVLKDCHPNVIYPQVGGHGVVAVFDSGQPGKTIFVRAELDGLPIHDTNNQIAHRSTVPNKGHQCGHDGHACILLGLAQALHQQPITTGKVALIFQPAEENGEGAVAMMQDNRVLDLQPDLVFALHNLPGYPLGQIVTKRGAFSAAVKSIIVEWEGKTSHAAEPEHGLNPAQAMAELLLASLSWSNNDPKRKDFAVVTPIHTEMGEIAYGVSAGHGVQRLTIRTWTEDIMEALCGKFIAEIQALEKKHGLKAHISWTQVFFANQNNDAAVDIIESATQQLGWSQTRRDYPFKWGEDFGLFTQTFPGAMFGLGSGEQQPALHNPDYDFPDALIEKGARLFYQIVCGALGR